MSEDEEAVVVIDNGSGTCKAGFAGEDVPSTVFSCVVGCPYGEKGVAGVGEEREAYVGDEAQKKRSVLSLKHPMEYGIVTDWDGMEKVRSCVAYGN